MGEAGALGCESGTGREPGSHTRPGGKGAGEPLPSREHHGQSPPGEATSRNGCGPHFEGKQSEGLF